MAAPYERGSAVGVLSVDAQGDVHIHAASVTAIAPDHAEHLWHVDVVTNEGDVVHALVDDQGHGGRVHPETHEVSKDLLPMDDELAFDLMHKGSGHVVHFSTRDIERDRGLER